MAVDDDDEDSDFDEDAAAIVEAQRRARAAKAAEVPREGGDEGTGLGGERAGADERGAAKRPRRSHTL